VITLTAVASVGDIATADSGRTREIRRWSPGNEEMKDKEAQSLVEYPQVLQCGWGLGSECGQFNFRSDYSPLKVC
jgi:hypothetical protein